MNWGRGLVGGSYFFILWRRYRFATRPWVYPAVRGCVLSPAGSVALCYTLPNLPRLPVEASCDSKGRMSHNVAKKVSLSERGWGEVGKFLYFEVNSIETRLGL